VFNNLFLATATIAVLVGTLYPLALDAFTGIKISVGAPFFDLTFGALMVPLLLVVPFGPFLPWKRASIAQASKRLFGAIVFSFVLGIIAAAYLWDGFSLTPLGLLLGFWVIIGSLADLVERSKLFKAAPSVSLRRLVGLPKNVWSTSLAHVGLGLTVLGVVFVTAYETETITTMQPGEQIEAHGYSIRFVDEVDINGPNFTSETVNFAVAPIGKRESVVASEKRTYPARQMPTTEAGIKTFGLSQVYISIGDRVGEEGRVVRIWTKPWILLIWFGAVVMAIAGTYSLTDRKYRIAAPNLVRKQTVGAAE
jgi:cytochrome c-type biogenesis protein CcmF